MEIILDNIIEEPKKKTYTEAQKRAIYKYREKKMKELGDNYTSYTEATKKSIYKYREIKKSKGECHYDKLKQKECCDNWRKKNKDKVNDYSKTYYNEKIKTDKDKLAIRNEKAREKRRIKKLDKVINDDVILSSVD